MSVVYASTLTQGAVLIVSGAFGDVNSQAVCNPDGTFIGSGGSGQNVTVVGPLGAQAAAASVAVVDTPLIDKQFCLNGTPTCYSDTSAHTGSWSGFQVISDAVFTSCTGLAGTSGLTFKAGMTIIAPITAFTLASGAIYPTPA